MPRYSLRDPKRRQAAILFVCVVLLTLFLVIGLCFVLFADAQATSSRFFREAHLNIDEYPSPEALFGWALGDRIWGQDSNTPAGDLTATRGHELARNMYGWDFKPNAAGTDVDGIDNYTPFNGIGRPVTGGGTYQNPWGVDDRLLLSYVYYPSSNDPNYPNNMNSMIYRNDGFKRNPERVGVQAQANGTYSLGNYVGGFNAPYTFPDLNNVYLAEIGMAQMAADRWMLYAKKRTDWRGDEVGFRLNWNGNTLHPNNQAWTNPGFPGGPYNAVPGGYDSRLFKYLSMRPRPVDQLMPSEIAQLSGMTAAQAEAQIRKWATPGDPDQRLFPLPTTPTMPEDYGDVRNLPGPGPNDSVWVDLSFGVIALPGSQKKVKPMFAFTIVDLDGRVNMNVAGNTMESSQIGYGYHGSNQGFGPWEINPRWLLAQNAINNPHATAGFPCSDPNNVQKFIAGGDFFPDSNAPWRNEYLNLFRGASRSASGIAGPAGNYSGRYGLKPDGQWDPRYWNPTGTPDPKPSTLQFPYANGAGAGAIAASSQGPRYYLRADYNGSSVRSTQPPPGAPPPSYGLPALWRMPNNNQHPYGYYTAMPYFPGPISSNPDNPGPFADGNQEERFHHAALFSPFVLNHRGRNAVTPPLEGFPSLEERDRLFPIGDMLGLINWQTPTDPTGPLPLSPYATSQDTLNTEFAKVWPNHIKCYPKLRNQITTLSMDLDRAGMFPGLALPPGVPPQPYVLDASLPAGKTRIPAGQPTFFNHANPALSLLRHRINDPMNAAPPGGDLRNNDWRSILGDLGRVNLNRPLTQYPTQQTSAFLDSSGVASWDTIQAWRADRDRVVMARDIFTRLRLATGGADPTPFVGVDPSSLPANDPNRLQFEALRYLAQLAVNIVDFIDGDDTITAFNFLSDQINQEHEFGKPLKPPVPVAGHGWVFGTELPRLVINEAYGQLQNAPEDAGETFGLMGNKGKYAPGSDFDPDTPQAQMNRPFQNLGAMDMPKATKSYRMNFFVELHNPHTYDQNVDWSARLQLDAGNSGEKNIYKVLIRSQLDANATRGAENVLGKPKPEAPLGMASPALVDLEVTDFQNDGTQQNPQQFNTVAPARALPMQNWTNKDPMYGDQTNNSGLNNGYLVLGPGKTGTGAPNASGWQAEIPRDRAVNAAPTMYPSISVPDLGQDPNTQGRYFRMFADVDHNANQIGNVTGANFPAAVFLQRLAKPNMKPRDRQVPMGADPKTLGDYNPYVTVDYVQSITVNDAVLCDTMGKRDGTNGMNSGQGQRQPLEQRFSFGRKQPFNATIAQQQPNADPSTIQQTFFRQNGQQGTVAPNTNTAGGPLDPFTWLVHYDRVPTSQMDLLHVSGFKPHELTQEYMRNNDPANHQAPWRDPNTRLFRGLELLGSQSFMNGSTFGGRVPGKININTIPDIEVWRALCDALAPLIPPAQYPNGTQRHYFSPAEVDGAWNRLQQLRQSNVPIFSMGQPYGNNQDLQFPQMPYSSPPPAALPGNGPERSMLMHDPKNAANGMFAATTAPGEHPYNQEELLRKIAGNLTTRSNVFAVYITTAYFEVRKPQGPGDPDGDQFQPPLLGREVDSRLRHKMFAIVDRTNLSVDIQNTYSAPPPAAGLRTQGARPIYFPLKPWINDGSIPTTPVDLRQLNVIPNVPTDATYLTYVPAFGMQLGNQLVVRDTIDHDGREYSDGPSYSGETAAIFPGMHLFLDVGGAANGQMEEIIVQTTGQMTDPVSQQVVFYLTFARLDGQPLKFKHARGASICTVLPGNPGPQPLPIPYDDPPYSNTVIPFRTILQ